MSANSTRRTDAWIGAGVGFVGFLFTGLLPALVYGGFMGLAIGGVLFGRPVEPQLLMRVMTGGGMLLGVLATMFLYLVIGAASGAGIGALVRRITGHTATAESGSAAEQHNH